MATGLSVIILTLNEADMLPRSLPAALAVADELLVVDSGSTDGTQDLAKALGAHTVLEHPLGLWSEQRNWAMDQAIHPWVLFIDADEVLEESLQASILDWKKSDHAEDAFFGLRRVHYFMGQRMRFCGLQSDVVVRLFHRSKRYTPRQVHERLDVKKPTPLPGTLSHFTFKNAKHWEAKQRMYAARSAADHDSKTGRITLHHTVLKPAFRFIKHYLLRAGFLDGKAGLIYSMSMAKGVYWRYQELKKLRNK